ncbi:hypothetical protein D3C72_2287630 [compost metagenome]
MALVLEGFTGLQQWLVANHAQAMHFLQLAAGILDDPVARDQLRSGGAAVADGDGIGELVDPGFGRRVLGHVLRCH